MAVCFELNRASLDADGSVQCKGEPDGTPCTLPGRSYGPPKILPHKCCDGKCREVRLCPSEEVKYDLIMQCQGKSDGTPCTLPCKCRNCRPPITRCCHGHCFRGQSDKAEVCPSYWDWLDVQCKGMPDGTSCTLLCRSGFCVPPYSRCCSGHCKQGVKPLHLITNKTEICPR